MNFERTLFELLQMASVIKRLKRIGIALEEEELFDYFAEYYAILTMDCNFSDEEEFSEAQRRIIAEGFCFYVAKEYTDREAAKEQGTTDDVIHSVTLGGMRLELKGSAAQRREEIRKQRTAEWESVYWTSVVPRLRRFLW